VTAMLLITALLLGALAFFEPCTIATHSVFAVRAHNAGDSNRYRALLAMWISRSALVIGILVLAVLMIPPPQWGAYVPSIILGAMALVYVISRFVYVPVPHLEFFKLLPGGRTLPHSVQLGLTLPACTLPLMVVIIGMAITRDSIAWAALAGALFATLFTLPVVYTAMKGVNQNGRDLLDRAARGTPYLTAILLLVIAMYLLVSQAELTVPSLKSAMKEASLVGIGIGFLAGFVFSFNPVSFASIPVVLAYVTRAHEERRALLMGAAFVFGMVLTHVVLGVAAALGGEWVQGVMGRGWGLFLGPLLIGLGLLWPGWIKIRLPWISMRAKRVTGIWGAFLLAIPFSIAVCPFCTPALLVTLTASAAIGSVPFGFALLLAFAAGRSIPIILGAWSMGWLESLQVLSRYQHHLEVVAGVILMVTGLYMLNEYFLWVAL